jgi:hypothetical protein
MDFNVTDAGTLGSDGVLYNDQPGTESSRVQDQRGGL